VITRQARQLGLKSQIIGSNASSSRKYPEIVGEAAAGTQNVITLAVLPESDEPKVTEFRQNFERRFPDLARQGRPESSDVLAYGGAQVFIEALKRAGRDLTRANFMKALESINNFESPLILPTTLSAEAHEGNRSARILEIQPDLSRRLLPVVISVD
jgi:branched-chain amino acid transport system substrate-binding protein